jgi:hypothetical protein
LGQGNFLGLSGFLALCNYSHYSLALILLYTSTLTYTKAFNGANISKATPLCVCESLVFVEFLLASGSQSFVPATVFSCLISIAALGMLACQSVMFILPSLIKDINIL